MLFVLQSSCRRREVMTSCSKRHSMTFQGSNCCLLFAALPCLLFAFIADAHVVDPSWIYRRGVNEAALGNEGPVSNLNLQLRQTFVGLQ